MPFRFLSSRAGRGRDRAEILPRDADGRVRGTRLRGDPQRRTVRRAASVAARWDKKDARRLPCVFAGSAGEGTLVIGGTEDGGLGFLSELDIEAVVTVTDMRGRVYAYVVSNIRHARKADSAALTSTGAPLVLFAKDAGSGDWLLALCTQP